MVHLFHADDGRKRFPEEPAGVQSRERSDEQVAQEAVIQVAELACSRPVTDMGRRLLGHHRLAQPKSRSGFVTAEILLLATGFGVESLRIGVAGTGETAFVGATVRNGWG